MHRPLTAAALAAVAVASLSAPAPALASLPAPAVAVPAAGAATGPGPGIALFTENGQGKRIRAAFTGTRIHVVGIVTPFVAGQQVTVQLVRNRRPLLRRAAAVVPLGDGRGRFTLDYRSRLPGMVRARATLLATPAQGRLEAVSRGLRIVAMHAEAGARGYAVWALQKHLAALGYSVVVNGRFDDATARAVVAYRKLTGLARTGVASSQVFRLLLRGHGRFHVRYRNHGRHFEADLTHQVLAEIDPGGRVRRIYEMSSGKPSTPTVVGTFRIYTKAAGTNAKGMFDSNYFIRGYAIHGYPDVPPYAASHGCLRIPIPDAPAVFAWARTGEIVDVYHRNGGGSHRVRGNAGP